MAETMRKLSVPASRRFYLFFLPVISGVLLILCFPKFSLGFLAWFALIPLLISIEHVASRAEALIAGGVTGFVFFLFSLHWLIYVTTFGWLFLVALETVFVVLFSYLVYEGKKIGNVFLRIFWTAGAWLIAEFGRSEMPVFGFAWNLLACSQAGSLWVLQSANTIGAYGLGFVIAFVNVLFAEIFSQARHGAASRPKVYGLISLAVLIGTLIAGHGYYHFRKATDPAGVFRISLIQGNIAQTIKWVPEAREKIVKVYSELTRLASFDDPDLILWPEAAFPGYFNRDWYADEIIAEIKTLQIPVLIGSPHLEDSDNAYNSAYLINRDGKITERYDKIYLVPFGEYVPLQPIFGWLDPIAEALGVSDFRAGHEEKVFHVQNDELAFSVLICFEDIFPNLVRHFVNHGARFLAVITNDAWFGPTAAPYQHLQASVLRAVENGVPVVRAANTGVSAFISRKGVVLGRVEDKAGQDIFITGHKTMALPIDTVETLYRRGGWFFPYGVILLFAIMTPLLMTGRLQ